MAISGKLIRSQLALLRPLTTGVSLEAARRAQDRIGELMMRTKYDQVSIEEQDLPGFRAAWVQPRDARHEGVVLYLHGGGYTCGSLEYALGFGTMLAAECGIRVFCAAYRLAPEDPYPAALDDAMEAYRALLSRGYKAQQIVLCGESAGGGLIYALCIKLKALRMPMPCALIGISPWTDLAGTGASYEENRDSDPTMTKELLSFYAGCYASDLTDPFVSPLYGELSALPPSLLFAGGDEIMLDDARLLHEKLEKAGCESRLIVKAHMWHAYVLYHLKENRDDFTEIDAFLRKYLPEERKLRWMRLDNAAKIYPAARRRRWTNLFRLSATLSEDVDRIVLSSALDVTVRRFPSIAVRLRRGVFWYYLEELPMAPQIKAEYSYPMTRMTGAELGKSALRVIVYRNRIAVEFFHALTDGTGGLIFLKTLLAEYLHQKYALEVPCTDGVLDRLASPTEEELEDSFLRSYGEVAKSRADTNAFQYRGTPESEEFIHVTTLQANAAQVHDAAKALGVSVTAYLTAVMLTALARLQDEVQPKRRAQKPVKVLIPVNLRPLFGSSTLRNFALYVTPGVDPKLGAWDFAEICRAVHHQMGAEVTAKEMASRMSTNVRSEKSPILKIMPLFIKNLAMKAVYNAVGERKSSINLSNLGVLKLPEAMRPYVRHFDFLIGPQATTPFACTALTWEDTLYLNFTRNIRESKLELYFYEQLRAQGIAVLAESNRR